MASKVPYDLIKQKLTNTVGVTYPVIEWDSVTQMLNQMGQSFISIEDVFSDVAVISVGTPNSNWFEEEGEIDIHIFVKPTDGYDVARTIGAEISTQMRMQYLSSEVRVFSVGPPNAGLIADGLWSSMIVGLSYRYVYQAPTFT